MSVKVELGVDLSSAIDESGIFKSAEIPYMVFGAEDETEALNEAYANVPESFNGLFRKGIKIIERMNETSFKVGVSYSGPAEGGANVDNEDGSFSFDTTGGTQTVMVSRKTIGIYPDTAKSCNGAINFDGDQVNGVEIIQPILNFTETAAFDAYEITTDFKKKMAEYTGCVNWKPWRGYAAGEVLFRGVTGSGKYHKPCELTFNFSFSANRSDFKVGDIEIDNKYGWDYMWSRYTRKIDGGNIVCKPIAVYIERLFEFVDFRELRIGN